MTVSLQGKYEWDHEKSVGFCSIDYVYPGILRYLQGAAWPGKKSYKPTTRSGEKGYRQQICCTLCARSAEE
jgi:hypothetical protein